MDARESRFAFLPRVSAAAALIVALIGAATLLGWIVGVYLFAELVPDAPRMQANLAIGFILLGTGLWLVRTGDSSVEARAWARVLSELVVIGAALTLAEHAFGWDLHIDRLFTDTSVAQHPGRPSPHAAGAVLVLALWLAVLDREGRVWEQVQTVLAAVSGLIVLAALIAYAYNVDYIYGRDDAHGVAPQTVFALLTLWVGILCARPASAWMRLIGSGGAGGHVIRRLVPAVVLIPLAIGYVVIAAEEFDVLSLRVGAAVAAAAGIGLLLAILVYTSRELEEADAERSRLERRLVELADRDPLTNLFNRRRLDEELRRLLAFGQRHGSRLGVLSIDLDGFKNINDTYGHATGDELLIATAEVLEEELRESDFAGRHGGDEFIVLLPDSDEDAARIVAGKLIRAMRGVQRPKPGGGVVELRASIGIALSDAGGWTQAVDLLAAADRALYEAKAAGGDRVAVDPGLVALD
jgi:diguanylate cyclase (GGDEF)-like protein